MAFERLAVAAASVVLLAAGSVCAAPSEATVSIDSGVVVGAEGDGVSVWRGVPYAAAPVGPLRWRPPQPVSHWVSPRQATTAGPVCPQALPPGGGTNGGGVDTKGAEDCLTLQVYAPSKAKRAPVMVWLHGGANMTGSSTVTAYDGTAFAKDGVVLVAANYRLGALGFFAHPSLTKSQSDERLANYGLMDQMAALEWVRRNIAAFGGDPSNVTVFGESAGGEDILALLAAPSAAKLFAKAIVESGLGWEDDPSLAQAEEQGAAIAVKAGAPPDASPDQLRALSVDALLAATSKVGRVIDGKLLPETPAQAFARGHANDVPLIIGANSWEASLIARYMELKDGPAVYIARQPSSVKAAYSGLDDKSTAYAMFTDGVMAAPARWIAGKAATGAPSWLYEFSFVPVAQRATAPGVGHAGEIRYVFGSWAGTRGPQPDADTLALTRMVHGCWVSFAKNGRPEKCAPGGWPAYDPVKDQLMEFGVSSGARSNFRKPQLDAWEAAKSDALSAK